MCMCEKIDFVVTWLDSTDSKWRADYIKYKSESEGRAELARFRENGLFKYWFRAVERYAPWVNKVFLVTNGKNPEWLNINNPKLVLIKHSDYIPNKYLPTFNSRTIEFFLYRIPGLSERFVYFNDDVILNSDISSDYYFWKGLPCDSNKETNYSYKNDKWMWCLLINNIVINAHFSKRSAIKRSLRRWLGFHLEKNNVFHNLFNINQKKFACFETRHFEQPYLKSTFRQLWNNEPDLLSSSCSRFRKDMSPNTYIFRYWQLASNRFFPVKHNFGKYISTTIDEVEKLSLYLKDPSCKSICINDTTKIDNTEYEKVITEIQKLYELKFCDKSSFEK